MARQHRVVPDSFAEFYASRVRRLTDGETLATGPYGCRGCGEQAAFGYLDASGEALCAGGLRYHLGYEQAEERNVRLIIGSAVAAALATGAPRELIHLAVDDALREAVRVDADLCDGAAAAPEPAGARTACAALAPGRRSGRALSQD